MKCVGDVAECTVMCLVRVLCSVIYERTVLLTTFTDLTAELGIIRRVGKYGIDLRAKKLL